MSLYLYIYIYIYIYILISVLKMKHKHFELYDDEFGYNNNIMNLWFFLLYVAFEHCIYSVHTI